MIIRTKIFEMHNKGYTSLLELARAMGIPVSQIHRVREGEHQIGPEFIVGAIRAFPNHNLDDLFYLTPELPCRSSAQAVGPGWSQQQSPCLAAEYPVTVRARAYGYGRNVDGRS